MAKFAYVENGNINSVYDELPINWKNISNFHLLEAADRKQYGWYNITKPPFLYDPMTNILGQELYNLVGDEVVMTYELLPAPPVPSTPSPEEIEQQKISEHWNIIRKMRDEAMASFDWRYSRYYRQERLGQPTTDKIKDMDDYMDALANITLQENPFNISWPIYDIIVQNNAIAAEQAAYINDSQVTDTGAVT